MAIQLDTTRIASQITAATTQNDAPAMQGAELTPVLGGENVKVTSGVMTDLEKLVARLKNESEDAKMSVSQRRLSILQTVLNSMADRITDAQRDGILSIETLNGEKAALEEELGGLESDKTAAKGRISALDVQIKALEQQIAQAVKDGADHREQVAKLKAQRAEEQAELDRIEGAIKTVSAKISDIDGQIATCTAAIGSTMLSEVSAALRAAVSDAEAGIERPESDADRRKAEAKVEATDVAKHISAALDKIDGQIRAALDEAQMKVEG